ncbi:MAG: chloride channel protein [Bryobacteraceae bacterium]|nr:chloride channel protein [Bryobacteraceae bacterium]
MILPPWAERWWSAIRTRQDVVLSIALGIVTSLVIVAFIWTTERVGASLYTGRSSPWARVIIPVLGALTAGYLVARFFPEARGSGIPQTKAALATERDIPLKTVIGKFTVCSISLGSGISLGREGPSVQIGAGIASVFGRSLKLSREETKSLAPVGTAAALAAAFNTPIAAVLFSLEEVLGDLHARMLGTVVIGAATSWLVLHLLLGDEPLFRVPQYQLVHPAEFILYCVLGVAGGLLSAFFQWSLLRMREQFKKLPKNTVMYQPAAGGLTVGLLALLVPEVLGVGYSAVDQALNSDLLWKPMMMLLLLKLLATVMSYSSGNPGGVFGPSLFFGAMLGGSIGSVAHAFFPAYTGSAGAYALVGMGTTFAGIIRTPMTSVIMIFELTRDYSVIVPLMICNLASYWVATRLMPEPIYEALAAQDGIHLPRSPERREEPLLIVRDAMRPARPMTDPELRIRHAAGLEGQDLFVGRGTVLWGVIRKGDLAKAVAGPESGLPLSSLVLSPAEDASPLAEAFPHVHPDHPLHLVLHRLGKSGLDVLPVVDRALPRRLLGEVTLNGLLDAYRRSGGAQNSDRIPR